MATSDVQRIVDAVEALREATPLVHCLTNTVVPQITANALLAAGAAPAMIDHPQEAGQFAAVASAVLVNVGNPSPAQVQAMRAAAASAQASHRPWVLDPVAVGVLTMRTELCQQLLTHHPAAIRGNASEIGALAGGAGGRGVDATDAVDTVRGAARELVARTDAVVAISGPDDLIMSGDRATWLRSGDPMMQQVIGTGCALGALVAAYLGAGRAAGICDHDAVLGAHAHAGAAGMVAAQQAEAPGSFGVSWLDALYTLTPSQVGALVEVWRA